MNEWISVKDRLPNDKTEILCALKHSPDGYHIHDGFFIRGQWFDGHGFPFLFKVTHWQPLPEPPKEPS